VSLGTLIAEQVVQVVLRVTFPLGVIGQETGVVLSVSESGAAEDDSSASASISWTYADEVTNDKQDRDTEVDRSVAEVFASRARQEASQLNRAGNYPAAQAALAGVAKRIRSYAGRDAVMRWLIGELEREAEVSAAPMSPAAVKGMYFNASAKLRSRDSFGKAMKKPER
jgi:hypothetical protein